MKHRDESARGRRRGEGRRRRLGPAEAAGALGLLAFTAAPSVFACPDCVVGKQARARILADGPWIDLALTALPLLVLVAIVAVLYSIGRRAPLGGAP